MGFQPGLGFFNRRNVVTFYHQVVLGVAGVVASQDAANVSGIVATKTGGQVGRYTLQIPTGPSGFKYRRLLWVGAQIVGTDTAALTASKGAVVFLRKDDIDANLLDGTIEVQFVQAIAALTDTEIQDSLTVLFRVEAEV